MFFLKREEQSCGIKRLENLSTAAGLHDEYKTIHNTRNRIFEFFEPKSCVAQDSVTAGRCHGRPPEFGSPSMLEEGPPAGTCHSVDTGSGKA